MITVAECANEAEAQLVKSLLEASGIAATLPDEFTAQNLTPLIFGHGIKVQVAEEDAETALALIAEGGSGGGDEPAAGV